MRFLITVLVALLLVSPAGAQSVSQDAMLRASVDNFIRPQIAVFVERAEALVTGMDGLCESPSEAGLAAAQAAFAHAATGYGRVEFLRVGPLMEANRSDRILFWPDRRGIGLRQVQQVLADADPSSATLSGLQQKSVALQGLTALEFVLFGTGFESLATSEGTFRCGYGRAIAENLAQMANELKAGWDDPDGIAGRLTRPDPAHADYRTTTEALEAVVGFVSHGVEALRDTRLNPFIAKGKSEAKPKQALFWRSGQTMSMLGANLEGLRSLLERSGVVTDADLAGEIAAAFDRAEAAVAAVTLPVEQAVADLDQAAALAALAVAMDDLQRLIGEELSAHLGLSVGFSSLDGD